jgi:hypothetical protein
MIKHTHALEVGDIVVSEGDPPMTERIIAVEPPVPDGVAYKLHVDRQIGAAPPVATFFYSGRDALHRVQS